MSRRGFFRARVLPAAVAAYRLLVRLHPPGLGGPWAEGMVDVFARRSLDAYRRGGRLAAVRWWTRALADLGFSVPRAWRDRRTAGPSRGAGGVGSLGREARLAVRRLAREPSVTLPALLTIALGVGASTAVFSLVHAVLLAPLPYPDPDRLVDVAHATPLPGLERVRQSPGTWRHYRAGARSFEDIALWYENAVSVSVTDGDAPERVRVAMVTPSFFPTLGVSPAAGRWFTAGEGREDPVPVIISHGLWTRRYGGDGAVVDGRIELNQSARQVVGVMPAGFAFPHPRTDVWYPMAAEPDRGDLPRDLILSAVGRLRPDADAPRAEAELGGLLATLEGSPGLSAAGLRPTVTPLRARIVEDVRAPLSLLALTATFVLLVTLANVAGLFLVRAERRSRELAVVRALGAGGSHLARRFACEGLALAAVGGAAGALLAEVGVAVRFGFAPGELPRIGELRSGAAFIAFAVLLSVCVALVITGASFLRARSAWPSGGGSVAGGRAVGGREWQRVHRALAAVQVALSLALLVGSAMMVETLVRITRIDPGFEADGVLTFAVNPPHSTRPTYELAAALHRELRDGLLAIPGVRGAEMVAWLPLTATQAFARDHVEVVGEPPPADLPPASLNLVTSGYFDVMGIPLHDGTGFDEAAMDPRAPPVILSARLADLLFGEGDPIGRRVHIPGYRRFIEQPPFTVVGVVGDVPGESLTEAPAPFLYFPAILDPDAPADLTGAYPLVPGEMSVVVRASTDPWSLVTSARSVLRSIDPRLPMADVRPLGDAVWAATARVRLVALLLLISAAASVALGVTGVYGIVAYSVSRRTAEIGVRLALGATSREVVRSVLGQATAVALAGLLAGTVAAYGLGLTLRSQLYEVGPTDLRAYLVAAALLLGVVLLAGWLPARRAGRMDAVEALRAE